MTIGKRFQHHFHRVLRAFYPVAFDKHGAQQPTGDETAHRTGAPIIGAGDGGGAGALGRHEACRNEDEIAVAGMVGEIDALPAVRHRTGPDRPHAGHGAGKARKHGAAGRLQEGGAVEPHVKPPSAISTSSTR